MLAAIHRASSRVSSFAADLPRNRRRHAQCYTKRIAMLPTARLPENLPTPTNSIVLFVVLCLFVFGMMAFAKFMQRRERKRRDD
jgi:hypothetical protein